MNLQDMMADWMQRFPRLAQRFGQGPQMQPSQLPPVMTGGQGQRLPMFNPQMGGDGQRFPMQPMTGGGMQRMPMGGGLNPQEGGYDSSGINPHGMYTGGNQRPGMGGLQNPRLMGLRRY